MSMRILYQPHEYSQQRQRQRKACIYPIRLAMEATYYSQKGNEVSWGNGTGAYDKVVSEPEGLPFLSLPTANRVLSKAADPMYQRNGNFKYHPGTYIMAASGCWHGQCTFCVERSQKYEVREVDDVLSEIFTCEMQGFKEIFDDSATFPTGDWLYEFCDTIIQEDWRLKLGCNMRMVDVDYKLMKAAGFRMLLFGLESVNQKTLDRINKGVQVEDWKYIKKAAEAGLEPHIAVMFGYPWETDKDAENTLKLVHYLLRKGFAKTAQASFYNPQMDAVEKPSALYFDYAQRYIKRIYSVAWNGEFWFNQLKDIRNVDDIKYLWRKIKAGLHIES
jgi:anaerobic magnesium-protoporphyrin IX monomethyl ester cyclase